MKLQGESGHLSWARLGRIWEVLGEYMLGQHEAKVKI